MLLLVPLTAPLNRLELLLLPTVSVWLPRSNDSVPAVNCKAPEALRDRSAAALTLKPVTSSVGKLVVEVVCRNLTVDVLDSPVADPSTRSPLSRVVAPE